MFHGINELYKNDNGYVFWRGINVEHFSHSDYLREKKSAKDLARKCLHLEALQVPVNGNTAVWSFSWFADMDERTIPALKMMLAVANTFYEHRDGRLGWQMATWFYIWNGQAFTFVPYVETDFGDGPYDYHGLVADGWRIANAGQGTNLGTCYATTGGIIELFTRHGLMDYLRSL